MYCRFFYSILPKVTQDHPEVGAVLQSYQQSDYDGLLNSPKMR
ncbi:hypothetical protein [Psychrobacter alimentarius]|nr:hypothetical protein [Psychrobacter alimentarius]